MNLFLIKLFLILFNSRLTISAIQIMKCINLNNHFYFSMKNLMVLLLKNFFIKIKNNLKFYNEYISK